VAVQFNKCLTRRFMLCGLLAAFGAGCSPEGSGSIKIENPDAVRSKGTGPTPTSGNETPKQAKARALEEEAAKKNPKLR
jgi:hypothetical protein